MGRRSHLHISTVAVHMVKYLHSADRGDFFDIMDYLGNKQGRCYEIGSALKLDEDRLDRIRAECLLNNNKALRQIISDWLKKNYNTERHGPPTWKALVKAAKSPSGGNDTELAEKIAKDHPAQSSQCTSNVSKETTAFT